MRRDVQEIVKMTPQEKQVMMFSATLPKDLRVICKKFMQEVRTLLKHVFKCALVVGRHWSSVVHTRVKNNNATKPNDERLLWPSIF